MYNLAITYDKAGRGAEAIQLGEDVVKLRKSTLGEDHPDTLNSMYNLAIDYYKAGRGAEALQLAERLVDLRKRRLGDDHPDTLDSMELLNPIPKEVGKDSKEPKSSGGSRHRLSRLWRRFQNDKAPS